MVMNCLVVQNNTISPGLFLAVWFICGVISLMGNFRVLLHLSHEIHCDGKKNQTDIVTLLPRVSCLRGNGNADSEIRRRVHLFLENLRRDASILGSSATFHLCMGINTVTATRYHHYCRIGFCRVFHYAHHDKCWDLQRRLSLFRYAPDGCIGCLWVNYCFKLTYEIRNRVIMFQV